MLGVLMAATMADMYVPLFGQRLAHMSPVVAGFFGAALSVGWTVGEIASASLRNDRTIVRVVIMAPLVMGAGWVLGALAQRDGGSMGWIALWALGLVLTGSGVGMAWPHLSAWAMNRDDPAEGSVAAAAINTVQLICGAFGAGLAGVVVNVTNTGDATSARWLFAVFAAMAALGCVASYRASRGQDTAA